MRGRIERALYRRLRPLMIESSELPEKRERGLLGRRKESAAALVLVAGLSGVAGAWFGGYLEGEQKEERLVEIRQEHQAEMLDVKSSMLETDVCRARYEDQRQSIVADENPVQSARLDQCYAKQRVEAADIREGLE